MGFGIALSRRAGLVLVMGLLSMFVLVASSHAAGQFIYWSNTAGNSIGRANIDASAPVQNFITTGVNSPRNIAVNDNHIFWANENTNTIGRANLDGTGVNPSFINAPGVYGLAVNKNNIFWTDVPGNRIGRANLDGSGVNASFITGAADAPRGIAVSKDRIYWANFSTGAITSSIGRANMDGSGANKLFVTATPNASGIVLDQNYIYWANSGNNKIGRVGIAGTSKNDDFMTNVNAPSQLAFGVNFMFWGDSSVARVGRAFVNGTGVVPAFVNATNPTFGVAISVAAPAIAVIPPDNNYGPRPIGSSTNQSFLVKNTGNSPLTIHNVSIAGTGSSQFLLSGNDCMNGQLAPNQVCTVSAKFVPNVVGQAVANIVIGNSTGSPKTVTLTGMGTEATAATAEAGPTAATSASIDSGTVAATPTVELVPPSITAKRPGVLDCVRLQTPSSKFVVEYKLSTAASVDATLLYIPRVKANIDSCRPGPKGIGSEPRFKSVRTMKTTGQTGMNKLKVSGKGLNPGRYRIRFKATDSQGVSQPSGANFLLVVS